MRLGVSMGLLGVKQITAGLPISQAHTKNYLPANQKGYDNSETTVGKLSAGRTQIFPVPFSVIVF